MEQVYTLPALAEVTTQDEARQIAIDWQHWFGDHSISYGELAEYGDYFQKLGEKFGLLEEFHENGII